MCRFDMSLLSRRPWPVGAGKDLEGPAWPPPALGAAQVLLPLARASPAGDLKNALLRLCLWSYIADCV